MAKAKEYIAIISNNSHYITENLDVDERFLSYLLSKDALGQQQIEKINARSTSRDKAFLFKQIIVKRGEQAFVAFIEALMVTRQVDLANKLDSHLAKQWIDNEPANMMRGLNITEASLRGDYFVDDEGDAAIDIRLKTVSKDLVKQIKTDEKKYYQLTSKPRGHAIILNNEYKEHKDETHRRKGGEVDAMNLLKLYHDLGFQTEAWTDMPTGEIQAKLKELSTRKLSGDAFIFTVLSHGSKHTIETVDEGELNLENEIMAKITKIEQLRGKPKIFIVQACRGDAESKIQPDSVKKSDSSDATETRVDYEDYFVPKDCFVMQATVPGYRAYRDTVKGSWFVRDLIYSFMEKCHDASLDEIASQVALRMEGRAQIGEKENVRQICQFKSYLEKTLYFLPNYPYQ